MKKYIPGIILCSAMALLAGFSATFIPLGAVTMAIFFGMALRNIKAPSRIFIPGIGFSEKTLLSWAIVFMGIKLDFTQFQSLGFSLAAIIVSGICFTLFTGVIIGRLLKMDKDLALLVSVGNAICGSSAIAAAQSVVKADEDKVGLSIAIINFLGTLGIFLLPALILFSGSFSHMQGGVLIGNCLQAIGQVSAAGFSIGEEAGQIATVVKMGRILMIMPVVLVLSLSGRGKGEGERRGVGNRIPWYITGFILFSIAGSLNILPDAVILWINEAGRWLLIIAMTAIGMKITLSTVLKEGKKALITGSILFLCQILFSMGFIFLFLSRLPTG